MNLESFNRTVQGFHYSTLSFLLAALNGKTIRFGRKDSQPQVTPLGFLDSCFVDKVEPAKFDIEKDLDGNPTVYITFHKLADSKAILMPFSVFNLVDQIHIVNCVLLKLHHPTKKH